MVIFKMTTNYVLRRDANLRRATLKKRSSTRALEVSDTHYDDLFRMLAYNYDDNVVNAQLDGFFRVCEAELAREALIVR